VPCLSQASVKTVKAEPCSGPRNHSSLTAARESGSISIDRSIDKMSSIRLLNVLSLPPEDVARLRAVSPRLDIVELAETEINAVQDWAAEIVFAHSAPPTSGTPALRWLQLSSAGVNHLQGSDIWQRQVVVTNARGVYAVPMAEYVMTAVLSFSNRVEERRELQVRHQWPTDGVAYECYGVRGRTMVIVGYGTVGRELARLAKAFGMHVLAIKANPANRSDDSFRIPRTGDPGGKLPDRIVGLEQAADLLRLADYVVLTLPLTPLTEGFFGRELLAEVRPTAWLINVGRGKVIDEQALIDRMRHRQIAGAWLDVFGQEPLPPGSPIWELPNVIVTPHLSGGNRESFHVLTDLLCENLRRYLAGDPLVNPVRPDLGY